MTVMDRIKRSEDIYHYNECGLENIYLLNGVKRSAGPRGERVHIEDLEGLHRAIGHMLVSERKRLNGRELRFLRHELNMTQEVVAALIGTNVQSVARWEKGRGTVTGPADRLIRLIYKEHTKGNKAISEPLRRLAELDEIMNEDQPLPVLFKDGKHGWDVHPEPPVLAM